MSQDGPAPLISSRLLKQFVHATFEEVGVDKLPQVLASAGLSPAVVEAESINRLDGRAAAELYARLQQALRQFYGRGARGTLLRIGRSIWGRMTAEASFLEKAELEIIRRLPVPARRRRTVDLVAGSLRAGSESTTVHLLDTDLLLVDRSAAAAAGQESAAPICFVTLGLLEAALYWATGQPADVEEIACRAMGAPACEFKVISGGG
ncbi:MAG: 4-vinyl reductase 4VR [Anaerolineaceae bacterium]|nr:MAG: 4-vinyl reductase 4VR [Anaerolineaceae bacterium]